MIMGFLLKLSKAYGLRREEQRGRSKINADAEADVGLPSN